MTSGEDNQKQWRFSTFDLLWVMTVIAFGLGAIVYAAKNSVSTFPQLVLLLVGWHILGGCLGAAVWRLIHGAKARIGDGFFLGFALAAVPPLILIWR